MTYQYYYCKEHRCWYAYWMDEEGNQLGEAVFAPFKEQVLIELGAARSECLVIKREEQRHES